MTDIHVRPGEGARHRMIDGDHVVKAQVHGPDGAFEVFEVEATAGRATPAHVSPWTGVLYVLDGAVTATVDGTTYRVERGGVVVMPAGTPCAASVEDGTARFLAITSGDRAGRFFTDVAAAVSPRADQDETIASLLAVTARHGVSIAV